MSALGLAEPKTLQNEPETSVGRTDEPSASARRGGEPKASVGRVEPSETRADEPRSFQGQTNGPMGRAEDILGRSGDWRAKDEVGRGDASWAEPKTLMG